MAERIRPEQLTRFDHDPDALEWARGIVQESVDLLVAALEHPDSNAQSRSILAWTADYMTSRLVGGHGEISARQPLGRFDARLADPEQDAEFEWGNRRRAGSDEDIIEAGSNEALARMRLATYSEYDGLMRRRVWRGDWEEAPSEDPGAAAVEYAAEARREENEGR